MIQGKKERFYKDKQEWNNFLCDYYHVLWDFNFGFDLSSVKCELPNH
ncbi:hypothetical protein [Helicobacter pylori]|nr:hypothetical protein [Helicobacter pylori]